MLDAVIDLSHHQSSVDFVRVRAAGVLGVVHKATEGATSTDDHWCTRRELIASVGLLAGAYHFGRQGDGAAQADHFLEVVGDPSGLLLALDVEPSTTSMGLADAEAFVRRVHERIGRYPVVYGTRSYLDAIGVDTDSVLASCSLWIARYADTPGPMPRAWSAWHLWQRTDGVAGSGPKSCDGVGACDRDAWNGDEATLRAWWGR